MDISFSNEFSCTSARISCSQEEITCFYSLPTSPTFKVQTYSPFGSQTEATTPTTYEDANSNVDEFEFETSRRFYLSDFEVDSRQEEEDNEVQERKERPQWQRGDSLPTMAFADELFCDGKVLPLVPPLKPPPRLQNGSDNKTTVSASATSPLPRSMGSAVRLKFSHQSFWNDDFDPFMEALEVVKEEGGKRGKSDQLICEVPKEPLKQRLKSPNKPSEPKGLVFTRRSLSPFRGKSPYMSSDPHCGPAQLTCEFPKQALKQRSRSSNTLLCEPKGLVFSRRVKLVGVDKNGPIEPNTTKEERRREKIMRFPFGKASVQRHKLKDKKAELGKFVGLDKDETVREVNKMTLAYYKPRLLLCLGCGGRYVK